MIVGVFVIVGVNVAVAVNVFVIVGVLVAVAVKVLVIVGVRVWYSLIKPGSTSVSQPQTLQAISVTSKLP